MLLEDPVGLGLCVGEGDGHGSQIVTFADAAPNCVRHARGRVTARADELANEHVAFAAPPDAAVGDSVVVHRESLSQTKSGGNGASPAKPQVAEEKLSAVHDTKEEERSRVHCDVGAILRTAALLPAVECVWASITHSKARAQASLSISQIPGPAVLVSKAIPNTFAKRWLPVMVSVPSPVYP